MKTQVLKPGLLVSLKSSVRGGVNYQRMDLESERQNEDGALVARWETRREIPDPDEFNAAGEARGKARSLVAAVCCPSSFGLLCPMDKEAELNVAIEDARKIARAHNAAAKLTTVSVYVLVGRIAQTDQEATRALSSEVRELLDGMRQGVQLGDVEAIREAANKARALGAMLTPEVGEQVTAAIKEARGVAREIVRRVEKAGESAAEVLRDVKLKAIDAARFSFLDLEEGKVEAEAPAGRAVDLPDVDAAAASLEMVDAPQVVQSGLDLDGRGL